MLHRGDLGHRALVFMPVLELGQRKKVGWCYV